MALLDAISTAVAEFFALALGKATGRVFNLQPEKARRIGEYIVMALVVSAGVVVTVLYS